MFLAAPCNASTPLRVISRLACSFFPWAPGRNALGGTIGSTARECASVTSPPPPRREPLPGGGCSELHSRATHNYSNVSSRDLSKSLQKVRCVMVFPLLGERKSAWTKTIIPVHSVLLSKKFALTSYFCVSVSECFSAVDGSLSVLSVIFTSLVISGFLCSLDQSSYDQTATGVILPTHSGTRKRG